VPALRIGAPGLAAGSDAEENQNSLVYSMPGSMQQAMGAAM